MLVEPKCHTRNCKHFIGVIRPDGTELTERNICLAYPDGIPCDIMYGDDLHLDVHDDQDNNIIYEETE